MAILDSITPKYYEVLNLSFRRGSDGTVTAFYNVGIRSITGDMTKILSPSSTLTEEEKQAVAAIFLRDKAQFEAATGLEEWVPPEEI